MSDDPYSVRPFESGDEAAVLELFRDVFDSDVGAEWFAWKYRENPYADHAPVVVAERDGTIVGARPFVALPMCVGGERVVALQPSDAMVHPDHRRRGLFTRMTRAALDRYGSGEPAFCYNFPNPNSLPGNLDLGWEVVQELPTRYRLPDAAGLLRSRVGGAAGRVAARLTDGVQTLLRVRERRLPAAQPGVAVRRHRDVPAGTLAGLHRDRRPAAVHATRDPAFYRWRFDEVPREYVTYVARAAGDPRGAVVVSTRSDDGDPVVTVVDVVPLGGHGAGVTAVTALLRAVVSDAPDAATILAPGEPLPDGVASAFALRDRQTPGLSRVTSPTTHVVRSLDGGDAPEQSVNGVDLRDAGNWRLTFAEIDYH